MSEIVIRSILNSKRSEDTWLDLLEDAFLEKPTPRSYFERHLSADRIFFPTGIRVLLRGTLIAATLRVYQRQIKVGNEVFKVGCLGEVCTAPSFRGEGLAKYLLQDTLFFMRANGFQFSALKTSTHTGLYEKFGYKHISENWIPVPFPKEEEEAGEGRRRPKRRENKKTVNKEQETTPAVREFVAERFDPRYLEEEVVVARLAELATSFNEDFSGVVVRDMNYWQKWMRSELTFGPFAMVVIYEKTSRDEEKEKKNNNSDNDDGADENTEKNKEGEVAPAAAVDSGIPPYPLLENKILGYLSTNVKIRHPLPTDLVVSDFAIDSSLDQETKDFCVKKLVDCFRATTDWNFSRILFPLPAAAKVFGEKFSFEQEDVIVKNAVMYASLPDDPPPPLPGQEEILKEFLENNNISNTGLSSSSSPSSPDLLVPSGEEGGGNGEKDKMEDVNNNNNNNEKKQEEEEDDDDDDEDEADEEEEEDEEHGGERTEEEDERRARRAEKRRRKSEKRERKRIRLEQRAALEREKEGRFLLSQKREREEQILHVKTLPPAVVPLSFANTNHVFWPIDSY